MTQDRDSVARTQQIRIPRFVRYGAYGLLFILCLILAARVALQWYLLRGLSAAELVAFHRFKHDPIKIPEEWYSQTRPYSKTVALECKAIDTSYSTTTRGLRPDLAQLQTSVRQLAKHYDLGEETYTSLTELIGHYSAVLDQTSKTVRLPEYDVSYFSYLPAASDIEISIELAPAAFLIAAHDLKWEEAIDWAILPIYIYRQHPGAKSTQKLGAALSQQSVAEDIALLAKHCDNAHVLRFALKQLTGIPDKADLSEESTSLEIDSIANIREYQRDGYPVELLRNRSALYYWKVSWMCQDKAPRYISEHLPENDPRHAVYTESRPEISPLHATLASWVTPPEWIFRICGKEFWDYILPRMRVATVKLNLATLYLAQRIMELDGNANKVVSSASFVPVLLEKEPKDPWTGKPYLWDPENRTFYSVGPDNVDQKCHVIYNGRNGELGPGDITPFPVEDPKR